MALIIQFGLKNHERIFWSYCTFCATCSAYLQNILPCMLLAHKNQKILLRTTYCIVWFKINITCHNGLKLVQILFKNYVIQNASFLNLKKKISTFYNRLKFWDERNNYFYNIIVGSSNYSVTIKVLQQYLKKIIKFRCRWLLINVPFRSFDPWLGATISILRTTNNL